MDDPRSVDPLAGSGGTAGYQPPPPFAPPVYRVAPLNETQVYGRSSYPPGADAPGGDAAGRWSPVTEVARQWPRIPGLPERTGTRRRRVSIAVAGAVVAALAVIAAVLVTAPAGHRPRTLTLPEAVDEYARLSTLNGAQLSPLFDDGGRLAAIPVEDLTAATVAVYGDRSDTANTLIFIGFSASDSPTVGRELRHEAAADVTASLLAGVGSTSRPVRVDAGPLGGAMRCGSLDLRGVSASAGVWADRDTLGIVLIVGFSPTEHTSVVTRDFRGRAEH